MKIKLYILLAVLCTFCSTVAHAQVWTKIGALGEPIVCVKFWTDYGHPEWGLAGTTKALYRTSDFGGTWAKVLTTNARINAIELLDRDNGWIAVNALTGAPSIYVTHTTGASWVALGSLLGWASDVQWNPKTKRLFLSYLQNQTNSFVSADSGVSWSVMGPRLMNGFAFSNGLNGILAPWQGNMLLTADGGLSWTTGSLTNEIWKPVGFRGTKTFFAAECGTNTIFRSNDGGNSWTTVTPLPQRSTGTLQGTTCQLYAQSFTVTAGVPDGGHMWVTYDLGSSWVDIGGPRNLINTRFQVTDQFIYAGDDTGAVWRYYQSSIPRQYLAVSVDHPTLNLPADGPSGSQKITGCIADTAYITITNVACDTQIMNTLSLLDSSVWKMQPITLPDTLAVGQSIRLRFITRDPHPGSYGSTVQLNWTIGKWASDTSINLMYDVQSIVKPLISQLKLTIKDRCALTDTAILFRNLHCDTLQLTSLTIDDNSVFQLGLPSVPRQLLMAPNTGADLRIPVHIASVPPGTYSAKVSATVKDGSFQYDTVITISLTIQNRIPFKLPIASTADLGKTSICGYKEVPFKFTNGSCDTMTLLTAEIVAPSQDFTLLKLPAVPSKLIGGGVDSFVVHFEPKTINVQTVTVHLSFMLDGVLHDTTFTIRGEGAQTLEANSSKQVVTFDTIDPCGSNEQTVYVKNLSCYAVNLTDLALQGGSRFTIVSPTLPYPLASGDSVAVVLKLTGSLPASNIAERLSAILKDQTQSKELVLDLLGVIKQGSQKVALSNAVSRDSLDACSRFDSVLHIGNLGTCYKLALTTVSYVGTGSLTVSTTPALPFTLDENGSLDITLSAATNSGDVFDGVVRILGPDIDTTIPIHLSVKLGGIPAAVLSASETNMQVRACDSKVIDVVIHNSGCTALGIDNLTLTGSNASQSQYSLQSPPAVPFTIAAGTDLTLKLNFDPAASGDGTITLNVRQSDGTLRTLTFTATIVPMHTARVAVQLATGSTATPQVGAATHVQLLFLDPVDPSDQLQYVRLALKLDQDFLTPVSVTPLNGWQITPESGSPGTYQFLASKASPGGVAANEVIADVTLQAFVAAAMSTDVQLSKVQFTPSDPNYEKCTLSSTPTSHVEMSLDPMCSDKTLSAFLGGRPLLSILTVRPNPAGKDGGNVVSIEFASAPEPVTLHLYSTSGAEVVTTSVNAVAGVNTATLPIAGLAEGTYYLEVMDQHNRASRKVAIVR